jgi:hypothetical protein
MRAGYSFLVVFLLSLAVSVPAGAMTISPAGGAPGKTIDLVLHEPLVVWGPAVQIDLGPHATVLATRQLGGGALHARVAISSSAILGHYDVTVTDAVHTATTPELFRIAVCACGSATAVPANVVVNPGFETGDMTGWIPTTWSIDTTLPHSGIYDAYDPGGSGGGGACIRQNFAPAIDSDDITSFTFWIRQIDDHGIAQVIVFHQIGGSSVGVAFTNDDDSWTFQDFTGLVLPNDFVTGIHVCGFGGGMPTPDDSWVDDFVLDAIGATPVTETTWGAIKSTMR